jgi:type IX secretion system PorP/SprF family membrane protein
MRIIVLIQLITLITSSACAQYFHFSQINYTDQRINPAAVASSDYATLNFVYRHQMTGGDFNINSSYISAAYPLLNQKNGRRWSGVGVSLMNDRSGGIFNTQEATLSYAANIYLTRRQTFTLGVKGLYQQRKINLDGLHTGSQYIPDRGFDDGAFSGEAFEQLQNNFFTLSFGMLWQATDRFNDRTAYASLSLFDLNKPNDSFLGDENELKGAVVAAFGFRAYQKGQLSIYPEMLYTSTYYFHVLNLGAIWEYNLNTTIKRDRQLLNIITKYVVGRSGILGIQFYKENFSVGFSYDFPIIIKNQGNVSTYEIGIQLRNLVETKLKSRQTKKRSYDKKKSAVVANKPAAKDSIAQQRVKKDSALTKVSSISLAKSLQAKQDSIATNVLAGKIYHDPVELEKIVLRFNFEFNSTNIDEESAKYLNEIAGILNDNQRLSLSLIGHTDNIGSEKFNMRLSKQRAQVVKDYLLDQDIASERIDVDGKGIQEPLNDNSTEEQRTLNRRVELKIIYTH